MKIWNFYHRDEEKVKQEIELLMSDIADYSFGLAKGNNNNR